MERVERFRKQDGWEQRRKGANRWIEEQSNATAVNEGKL